MHKKLLFFLIITLQYTVSNAQLGLERYDSVQVKVNGAFLKNSWAGGLNFGQFSTIDLNLDGIKDLVVFDRTGNKVNPYLNMGTPNQVDYKYAPKYAASFPPVHDWMLLADYNCDGKEDIFTYSIGGFSVYENISAVGVGLYFKLKTFYLKSHYSPLPIDYGALYVSAVDIPAITDVDNDGDLDVLTFDLLSSTRIEFHQNMTMENYVVKFQMIYLLRSTSTVHYL